MHARLSPSLARPIVGGITILVALLLLLGFAIRDPRPHDLPVGIAAPPPVTQQLTTAFDGQAPGAFAFTTYASEAEAREAVGTRAVAASLIVTPGGSTLVVAQAAGDAVTGAVTGAFGAAFEAQGQPLVIETVHPFSAGDAHGIVQFFLVLATLIAAVAAGVLTVFGMADAGWVARTIVLGSSAILAGIVGGGTASWLVDGYGDGIWATMGVLALASFAVSATIAGLARRLGAQGVALGVGGVVLLGLVASGGPLGRAFLPDAYRAVAPWLPVEPTLEAVKSFLYFAGAGAGSSLVVLAAWAVAGMVVLAAGPAGREPAGRVGSAHA